MRYQCSMTDLRSYTVGWICANSSALVAARALLDEEYPGPGAVAVHDSNCYTLGRIGTHQVVIAILPDGEYGSVSAMCVSKDMLHTFPNIGIGFMVGTGGAAPSSDHDIRLGDVVISMPRNGISGVCRYDFGKTIQDQPFIITGYLNQPSAALQTAVAGLKSRYEAEGHQITETIEKVLQGKHRLRRNYGRPEQSSDVLYKPHVVHPKDADVGCESFCGSNPAHIVLRKERVEEKGHPAIHYGPIGSANRLMKCAHTRDQLAKDKGVLCFEMEAAGLMNHFPCLVVRGICNYADTHKNKRWQGYAAMAAAAYVKDLLRCIAIDKVETKEI